MRNVLKRLAVFTVCAAVLLGGSVACKKEDKNNNENENFAQITVPSSSERGTHKVSVSETKTDLIKNGSCEYKIVVPASASRGLTDAASELNYFLSESAGTELAVVYDNEVSYGSGAKYFVLGSGNSLFASAGVTVPQELGRRGAFVETKDNSVFMAGQTDVGTLNAVYEWLGYQINLKIYGSDEIFFDRDVVDMKLKKISVTEVPDITDLSSTYGWTDNDALTCGRMRYTGSYWMTVDGNTYHNSFNYLPPEKYKQSNPEWYSVDGTQLCYTAQGNGESLQKMQEAAFQKLKTVIIANPSLKNVTFTQQDDSSWCTCKTCLALNEKYGTDAVGVIRFCNALSEKVNAWFNGDGAEYKRDLQISFFAYHSTLNAPAVYDKAADKYVAADKSVVCAENVGVIYAPIRASYQVDLADEYNKVFYDNVRAWGAVCKNLNMWTYSTNFHYYLVPTNTYNSMKFNYRFLQENGTVWLLDQAQYGQIASGFSALKLFLNSKLAWNVSSDVNKLIDEFFENYFGPAAYYMREYFDELRAHWAYLENEMGYIGDCYLEPLNQAYWPSALLNRWIDYIAMAQESLSSLKESDLQKYKMYSENVLLESISPRFLLIDLSPSAFSADELYSAKQSFKDDCITLGITNYSEKRDISELWSSWKI